MPQSPVCGHTHTVYCMCSVLWGTWVLCLIALLLLPPLPTEQKLLCYQTLYCLQFYALISPHIKLLTGCPLLCLKVLQVTVLLVSCILCVGNLVCCAGSFSATFKAVEAWELLTLAIYHWGFFLNYIGGFLLSCVRSGWEKHCDFLFQMQMKLGKYDSPTAIPLVLVPLLEHSCAQQLVWNQRTRKFAQLADINRESVTMRDA